MINRINSQQNFGTAYKLAAHNRLNEILPPEKEQSLLKLLVDRTQSRYFEYKGRLGDSHVFSSLTADILYQSEKRGLMANVKYLPKSVDEDCFYLIGNNVNAEMDRLKSYEQLDALNPFAQKKMNDTDNTRGLVEKIVSNFQELTKNLNKMIKKK